MKHNQTFALRKKNNALESNFIFIFAIEYFDMTLNISAT